MSAWSLPTLRVAIDMLTWGEPRVIYTDQVITNRRNEFDQM
jgi:hypothetical protein